MSEQCRKCGRALQEDWIVCPVCGTRTVKHQSTKKRGNGQGTILRLPNGKYKAVVTLGYWTGDDGRLHRRTRSKVFGRRGDAVKAIPDLLGNPKVVERKAVTWQGLYEKWLPTHRAGASTLTCYKAAFKYFSPLYTLPVSEIDVDDLQECLDDCPKGKRTRENMRAVAGLMYKYGIPRKMIPDNMNLASFLKVDGDPAAHRAAFTDVEIEKIKKACGIVPQAEIIYCMIYLGFRPSEFLAIRAEDVDIEKGFVVGGAKTEAGKGRIVTISPRISRLVAMLSSGEGYIIGHGEKPLRLQFFADSVFYPTLEKIGIENPMVEDAGGGKRHKYTPHSCRHTFATLMKRVEGADKDKMELIGHASGEMLRYYQDVDLADLKKITDAI